MDVHQSIYGRRAVRSYKAAEVPREIIEQLLDAAVHAPNAVNMQPWAFVVVEDHDVMDRISTRAKELMRSSPAWGQMEPGFQSMVASAEFNIFYHAPVLIVICSKPIGDHADWDCCFATENLMLQATELGLGTCPIGLSWAALKESDIKKELKIPGDYDAVMPIIVGYPAEIPPATGRRPAEILSWIKSPVHA